MHLMIEIYKDETFAGAVTMARNEPVEINDWVDVDFNDTTIIFSPGSWRKRPAGTFVFHVDELEPPIETACGGKLLVARHRLAEEDA